MRGFLWRDRGFTIRTFIVSSSYMSEIRPDYEIASQCWSYGFYEIQHLPIVFNTAKYLRGRLNLMWNLRLLTQQILTAIHQVCTCKETFQKAPL